MYTKKKNVARNVLFIAQNHNKSTTIIIFLIVRNTPRVHTIYMNHLFLPSIYLVHINIKCKNFMFWENIPLQSLSISDKQMEKEKNCIAFKYIIKYLQTQISSREGLEGNQRTTQASIVHPI